MIGHIPTGETSEIDLSLRRAGLPGSPGERRRGRARRRGGGGGGRSRYLADMLAIQKRGGRGRRRARRRNWATPSAPSC